MKHLLNLSQVRRFALEKSNERLAGMHRPPKFRRVSKSLLDEVEAATRRIVTAHAVNHAQRGVTLRGGLL